MKRIILMNQAKMMMTKNKKVQKINMKVILSSRRMAYAPPKTNQQ